MNSYLDQLNLTPQERRIVVGIAVVVFVVLNLLLVWPHFGDLKRVRQQLADTRDTMQKWNKGILMDVDPSPSGYKNQLARLQRQQGGGIGTEQIQLQRTVQDQARKTGVMVDETRAVNAAHPETNDFYEEQSVKISFACQEAQLINFLFNMGNDPAMVRVRELTLRPADANRYALKGDAILSANYARQTPKPAPKPATAVVPVVKPPPGPPPALPGNRSIPMPKPPPLPVKLPGVKPTH